MIICILNKQTNVVVNRIVVNNENEYVLKDNEKLSDNHDGHIGWIRENETWVNPNQIVLDLVKDNRIRRNTLLLESDWTQFNDSPLNEESKLAWKNYRQALRDLPEQTGFPNDVIWPVKPD